MGYKANPRGGFFARVCAHCPDKAQADRLARDAGLPVSHGICERCYAKQLSALMGEQSEP